MAGGSILAWRGSSVFQCSTFGASHAGDGVKLVPESTADCGSAGAPDSIGKNIPCLYLHARQGQHVHGSPQLTLLHAPTRCLFSEHDLVLPGGVHACKDGTPQLSLGASPSLYPSAACQI